MEAYFIVGHRNYSSQCTWSVLTQSVEIEMPNRCLIMLSEGLAVGVGFGAVGKSSKATFESARSVIIRNIYSYLTFNYRCFVHQEPGNWYWNSELSRRPSSKPTSARFRPVHMEELLVNKDLSKVSLTVNIFLCGVGTVS